MLLCFGAVCGHWVCQRGDRSLSRLTFCGKERRQPGLLGLAPGFSGSASGYILLVHYLHFFKQGNKMQLFYGKILS